ncbi:UpxY family transcription antiterminator [Prevotella sp.]|uniref:UpxY family transcription antiterminator n=1 Tax=Prevotella sp. TaxID=59823 RepID=UPI00307B2CE0
MNALVNAHTRNDDNLSPCTGLISNVLPEAQRSQTGVSSDYVHKKEYHWFVLRVTYNRTQKACDIIANADVQSYMPMHYIIKKEIGKKKRILQPLLPNLFFVYTTREIANSIVKKKDEDTPILKYYLDKTKPKETNGKHPPLTIPFDAMTNFIKATSTESDHVRIVSNEQCHYKSGDIVKVIDGEFKGVTGRVARIAGQQRVVVEIAGLCMVATAYIPSAFLEVK